MAHTKHTKPVPQTAATHHKHNPATRPQLNLKSGQFHRSAPPPRSSGHVAAPQRRDHLAHRPPRDVATPSGARAANQRPFVAKPEEPSSSGPLGRYCSSLSPATFAQPQANPTRPVVVADEPFNAIFIDYSNILVGFQDLCRLQRPATHMSLFLDWSYLFSIIERRRSFQSKVLVASEEHGLRSQRLRQMSQLGYDVTRLERVNGREQCVDELLQGKLYKMMFGVSGLGRRVPAGSTIVLCTGDGKHAQYEQGGFYQAVCEALQVGWRVEIVSWQRCMSSVWRRPAREHFPQCTLVTLDHYFDRLVEYVPRFQPAIAAAGSMPSTAVQAAMHVSVTATPPSLQVTNMPLTLRTDVSVGYTRSTLVGDLKVMPSVVPNKGEERTRGLQLLRHKNEEECVARLLEGSDDEEEDMDISED